jgi:hypothetical protein
MVLLENVSIKIARRVFNAAKCQEDFCEGVNKILTSTYNVKILGNSNMMRRNTWKLLGISSFDRGSP